MNTPDIPVGAKVSVTAGVGVVRWNGVNPKFSSGRWVGIELDTPTGKNNGSVQGEAYFDCRPNHGVFVRPSQVKIIELPPPRAVRTRTLSMQPQVLPLPQVHVQHQVQTQVQQQQQQPQQPPLQLQTDIPQPRTAPKTPSATSSRLPSGGASRASTPASRPVSSTPAPVRTASGTGTGTGTPARAPSRASDRNAAATPVRPPSATSASTVKRPSVATGRTPRPSLSGVRTPSVSKTGLKRPAAISTAAAMVSPSLSSAALPPLSAASSAMPLSAASTTTRPVSTASTSDLGLDIGSPPPKTGTMFPPEAPSVSLSSPTQETMSPPSTEPAMLAPRTPENLLSPLPEAAESVSGTSTIGRSTVVGQQLSPRVSPRQPLARSLSPDREAAAAVFAQKRELDELRIKVRLLETRRHEDAERIKVLEKKEADADQLHAVRAKLQAKFLEQQSALANAQRISRDLQSENALLETRAQEALDQLEMATLDREVAEEKAEAAEAELERLNGKIEELELEVAVLKEENAEYEKPVAGLEGERSSLAFVQLEKHNERLKEALIRLRDVSAETEREFKTKLADLNGELSAREDLKGVLELTEAKLSSAEAQVEDLKQQLDDALGAEDLLEELTDRNLQMSEKIEEMRATIEDLEALKELSEELEENHVEAEKLLEEEISVLSAKLRDEMARAAALEVVVVDMEATIGQFRELVSSLQSEIDTLRVQQATQEYETATATKESQALLNLNLKLQTSAAKTQSKTIDLDLKKLEANQLHEHLRVVQAYLPDAYHEMEEDSVTALLFFLRVGSKVDMLTSVISNLYGLPAALHSVASEALVGICELRGKMRHFAALNRRFAAVMRRASSDDWVMLGKVVTELTGVEPKVDGWVQLVKSDEFNAADCARELDSLIAQFNHLAEVMFNRPGLDAAEQQLDLAYNFEDDLDNFAAAVGFVRQAVVSIVKDGDITIDVGESTLDEGVYEPVQRILNQARAVKAPAGKLVSVVEDAVAGQYALLPEFTAALGELLTSVSHAVDIAVQVAQRIGAHIASIRQSKEPLRLADIDKFLSEVTVQVNADMTPWEVISSFMERLAVDLADTLPKFRGASKGGQTVSIDVPPPWIARVAAIKEAAQYNAEAERKMSRLSEELKDMAREVKIRDQNLQEANVKIETLGHRLESSRKQADMILELENDIAKSKKQEKVYEEAMEQLQAEYDALEAENARLRKNRPETGSPTAATGDVPVLATAVEAGHLVEQIESLRAAIRFLRNENALLKSKDLYNDVHMLTPLRKTSLAPLPPLAVPELVDESSDPESDGPRTPPQLSSPVRPTRQSLATESKLLLRDLARMAAAPRIVDISHLGPTGPAWRSRKNAPDVQVWRWENERRALEDRVQDLGRKVRGLK